MIQILKKYANLAIILVMIVLGVFTYTLYQSNIKLNKDIAISKANEKAFIDENSLLKDKNRGFKFTIDQLNYFNDSIIKEMNIVRKELRIKDKELQQLQYLLIESSKKDTIVFTDTIFSNPSLSIDTVIGDIWYQLKLSLRYPNTIITEPKFINKTFITVSSKKETIDPPKKFFLLRWFQKKHKVVEVNIVEKNPYSEIKQQRFIEIIK